MQHIVDCVLHQVLPKHSFPGKLHLGLHKLHWLTATTISPLCLVMVLLEASPSTYVALVTKRFAKLPLLVIATIHHHSKHHTCSCYSTYFSPIMSLAACNDKGHTASGLNTISRLAYRVWYVCSVESSTSIHNPETAHMCCTFVRLQKWRAHS